MKNQANASASRIALTFGRLAAIISFETVIVPNSINPWLLNPRVHYAASQLWQDGVIAYPTEAVWGLGCNPFSETAVMHLLSLKARPVSKGLILLAGSWQLMQPFIDHLNDIQIQRLKNSWPGPITWLIPKNHLVPAWVSGDSDKVAVRISNHPVAAALSQKFGAPIISTSCNTQGREAARSIFEVRKYFGHSLDAITSGKVGDRANPSEIRDLISGKVMRPS